MPPGRSGRSPWHISRRRWRILSILPVVAGSLLLTFGSITAQVGGDGLLLGLLLLALGAGVWLASQLAAREGEA